MKISNDRTLKALQADFQKEFPFLKIEFYKTPHQYGEETIQNYFSYEKYINTN